MTQETQTQASVSTEKTLFQILEERNASNMEARKPSILGSAQDIVSNSLSIVGSSFEALAKGLELGNGYITEELDRQVAARTTAKVESTIEQLEAIGKLVALGATVSEATVLATSYRR
jgi:hypothetical protein